MSKVKRWHPYGCDGLSGMMGESELGNYVSHEDYEALLAERDALKALLISSREFVTVYVNSSFFGPNARKQLEAIDAALQQS